MGSNNTNIRSKLLGAERVLISGHTRPDQDCVGSVYALGMWLRSQGVQVTMHLPEEPQGLWFRKLELDAEFVTGKDYQPTDELVVLVDVPTDKMTTLRRWDIVIDHHQNSDHGWVGDAVLVLEDEPAAAVIVADIIGELTPESALGVYLGIYGDTGGFQFNNVTGKALRQASWCVEVDGSLPAKVAKACEALDLQTIRGLGRTLVELEEVRSGVFFGRSYSPMGSRFLSRVADADVVVLENDRGTLELRSPNGTVDVSAIAKKMGGGGHRFAAGCPVADGWREQVLQLLG